MLSLSVACWRRRFALTLLGCALLGCDGNRGEADAPGSGITVLPDGRACTSRLVYPDADEDGVGTSSGAEERCLDRDEVVEGFATVSGDCAPDDPDIRPGADEICGDSLDENCSAADEECPTSAAAGLQIPGWACEDDAPPNNVIAWAVFDQDNEYYQPGACFVFFEGLPDEFYVMPRNLTPTPERAARGPSGVCEAVEGCICPSIDNWSYDRGRLYAFTLEGAPDECEKIVVVSHGGDDQVVSNGCRKFLFQIWFNPNDYSFVGDEEVLRRRLQRFDQVEIACFEGQPFDDLPFASLLTTPIRWNDNFAKQ